MNKLPELFVNNRRWAARTESRQPGFFAELAAQQAPRYLWIGCSDSRVPANEIVGLAPGELFVHRNVANLVLHTDFSCLSVLQYAIDVLGVEHVMVVGHYGCGGVQAACEERPARPGRQLAAVGARRRAPLSRHRCAELADDAARARPPVRAERAACRRVALCRSTVVQQAWERGQRLVVHAWVYRLTDGIAARPRLLRDEPRRGRGALRARGGSSARSARANPAARRSCRTLELNLLAHAGAGDGAVLHRPVHRAALRVAAALQHPGAGRRRRAVRARPGPRGPRRPTSSSPWTTRRAIRCCSRSSRRSASAPTCARWRAAAGSW